MSDLLISLQYYMGEVLGRMPAVLLAGIICILVLRQRGKRLTSCRSVVMILFVCYMAGLLSLTALPNGLWTDIWYRLRFHHDSGIRYRFFTFEYNLIPDFWRNFGVENLSNLLLYVPFGFFVPLLWKKVQGWRTPALGFALCLCIEVIQLVIGRSLDANDLILNTAGAAVGYLVFLLFQAILPHFVKKCQEAEL